VRLAAAIAVARMATDPLEAATSLELAEFNPTSVDQQDKGSPSGAELLSSNVEPKMEGPITLEASNEPITSIKFSFKTPKEVNGKHLPPIPAASPREDDTCRVRLGICAMDKKARSKPMAEILSRLDEDLFSVVFFGDAVLLNEPAESWPVCDVLVAFYSKGYPLQKAKEYVALCKPFLLNDLGMQELMQDRRRVYDHLEASGIDIPRHVYLSRDSYVSTGSGDGIGSRDQEVKEFDDHIEVNGVSVQKPFVEKPVNAEGE
jgi:hypothetical protein